MVRFFANFSIVITILFLASCGPDSQNEEVPTSNELSQMSPEERKEKAPNEAFEAVYLRDDESVETLLDENQSLFRQMNSEGRTPLMVALQNRRLTTSRRILNNLPLNDLYHQDSDGRGYVSHIAQQGYVQLLDVIAERYKSSLRWYNRFKFHHIDFVDNNGKTAIFYAKNAATAQRLKEHWFYGLASSVASVTWWSGFYQTIDNSGQSFIHQAAFDNRYDVLKWAVAELCPAPILDENEFLFGGLRMVGKGIDWAGAALQQAPLIPQDLFNLQSLSKDTALHLAVRQGNKEAAMAIMSCRHTNYGFSNVLGRNSLAELLANTEKHTFPVDDGRKAIFDSLHTKLTRAWAWLNSPSDYVNQQDTELESALHHAAKLKDPYFYDKLKDIGDIHLLNANELSPLDLFQAR